MQSSCMACCSNETAIQHIAATQHKTAGTSVRAARHGSSGLRLTAAPFFCSCCCCSMQTPSSVFRELVSMTRSGQQPGAAYMPAGSLLQLITQQQ